MALTEQEKISRQQFFRRVCDDIRRESAERTAEYARRHRGKTRTGDWARELSTLLDRVGREHATRNKKVSLGTLHNRRYILFLVFEELRKLGYKPQSIFSFGPKHAAALFAYWEQNGLEASTLQGRHTALVTFCKWVGKPGLIKPLDQYLQDPARGKRIYVAQQDKSWQAKELLTDDIIAAVTDYDKHVGIQLKLLKVFGLRRKEAVCFRPHVCLEPDGQHIQVYQGTKGGRFRIVPVHNDEQRSVLAEARALCHRHNDHVGKSGKTLEQNLRRLQYVFERFGLTRKQLGVTAHGLRHEYANNRYRQLTGEESPLRGGDRALFGTDGVKLLRRQIAEELGHSRISVTTAYYGSTRSSKPSVEPYPTTSQQESPP